MITFEEALQIVLSCSWEMAVERVNLPESQGRFLAEDVVSDIDMPPFDKSAMDGYAYRRGGAYGAFEVVESIAAGYLPTRNIMDGQCARIMTGAVIPVGADCVARVEDTELTIDGKMTIRRIDQRSNIAYKGEDIKVGDVVLRKGMKISPQHIAVLASVGCVQPKVFIRPRVAIFSTGNEIVEPEFKPGTTQIRNSNAYQLMAQVDRAGAVPVYLGIIPDDEEQTFLRLQAALNGHDLILMTGGVSMGDFDFIPGIISNLGIDIKFRTIAMQPGKPTVFGALDEKYLFGLPGNPVSSFNVFELLVRPLIEAMMGRKRYENFLKLPLGTDYNRKKSHRLSWIPARIIDGKVFPSEYHGSAHILSLSQADGIAAIPIGVTELKTGELIDVRQI